MPLRLIPEVLNAFDVVATGGDERLAMVHTPVTELGNI